METWGAGGDGGPVLVMMSDPGASLAGELRRELPGSRAAVGDDRRVLVSFDRGGWSPAVFAHMAAAGFDVLTWRRGTMENGKADSGERRNTERCWRTRWDLFVTGAASVGRCR